MPLSEREQRILEEIERNLYDEDPGFARGVRQRAPHLTRSGRLRLGALLFVAGFAILIGFFIFAKPLVGVVAFVAMVSGIVLVTGSLGGTGLGRAERRRRVGRYLEGWEERIRRRYKRP
jgi:hypothetical protein